eukprot:UN01891
MALPKSILSSMNHKDNTGKYNIAKIGDFESNVLNITHNETKEIKRWKKCQPQMNEGLNQIKQSLRGYSNTMEPSQAAVRSAANLHATSSMTVNAINSLMANAVMKAEIPKDVSDAYKTAHALSTRSMSAVANVGAQTALYNQSNLLQDLKREKSIQNDPNARGDVMDIYDIDRNMRRQKKMRLKRLRKNAERMNRHYDNLRKNPKVPKRYGKRIGTQQNLWNVVIGIAKVAGAVALVVGIGAAIYVVIDSDTESRARKMRGVNATD